MQLECHSLTYGCPTIELLNSFGTYNGLLMTERLLEAGLSYVSDKELGVRVSEDVLLRQPLGQLDVGRQVRHRLRLPLPQHFLL